MAQLGQSGLEAQRALRQAAAEGPPTRRPAALLDLGRLLLAQGLGAEARTVANMVEPSQAGDAAAAIAPARQAVAGAAGLLLDDLSAAAALRDRALDGDPEIDLWRAGLAAKERKWPDAAQAFTRSAELLRSYPPRLQLQLGSLAAEAALATNDLDGFEPIVDWLAGIATQPSEQARVQRLQALGRLHDGELASADELWRQLARSPDQRTRVASQIDQMIAKLAAEPRDPTLPAQAESQLPLWRGHPMEADLLDALAEHHRRGQDVLRALRVWQRLAQRGFSAAATEAAQTKMRSSFAGAFEPDQAQSLPPLASYIIVQEFPELMPDGEPGRRLRRALAGRLAALDLIAPASALLEELLAGTADPSTRAALGAAIAELQLREPDGGAALEALQRTRPNRRLPDDLMARRQVLEAQALNLLGQPGAALTSLAKTSGQAAALARIDALWALQDWPRLIAAIDSRLAAGTLLPFDPASNELLARLAIARSRVNDRTGLLALEQQAATSSESAQAALHAMGLTSTAPADAAGMLTEAADHLTRARALQAGAAVTP